jgi:hypothetical protein
MILRIRHEQVNALAEARYEEFESRAIGHLREFFLEKVSAIPADRLRAFIRRCMDRARTFGLTSEQAVVCFAHLSLLLGEGFDAESRWAFVPFLLHQEEYHQNDRAKAAMLLAYELKARGL